MNIDLYELNYKKCPFSGKNKIDTNITISRKTFNVINNAVEDLRYTKPIKEKSILFSDIFAI